MKLNIINIGNSKGIRIPNTVLKQCYFEDEVELEIQDHNLILKPVSKVRQGWAESFEKMSLNKEDQLLDKEFKNSTTWDNEEWEWK